MRNGKSSHSPARAGLHRSAPPAGAQAPQGPPTDTVTIATGPNTTGHTDQVASVHVDHEDFQPADAVTEVGQED